MEWRSQGVGSVSKNVHVAHNLCCGDPGRVGGKNEDQKDEEKGCAEPWCSGRIWLMERSKSHVENKGEMGKKET